MDKELALKMAEIEDRVAECAARVRRNNRHRLRGAEKAVFTNVIGEAGLRAEILRNIAAK